MTAAAPPQTLKDNAKTNKANDALHEAGNDLLNDLDDLEPRPVFPEEGSNICGLFATVVSLKVCHPELFVARTHGAGWDRILGCNISFYLFRIGFQRE